ncbi:MAG: threonylcarbamoyl-AMP synthase [Roseitalea sp.]|nr:threonylcarbamoyl-AMP synthase [Roseitalea sp.]MBO6953204.1 threonylcarbamoyl-AMP synthase [Rhizobiaceae bacterium]MBO6593551.1 threonylcarbamoyl-AMP synthase [Roseitalea sp.]MBO6600947.1 threonylcarbamoyl-AMP synthase [Roseitalea sp.]MBO6612628.1 threonylcarbamoyl-AMP synthase [Roseitalea sp.]
MVLPDVANETLTRRTPAETAIVPADEDGVRRAARLLAEGDIAALPTETVYGLAADATNGEAVARIFAAKRRPRFNPLICHVDGLHMARGFADLGPLAEQLAEIFWPGPLTLVVPLAEGATIHPLVTAGLDTVAVRMPRGVARDLISALGRPVAAPSANRSGRISPTTAHAVRDSLGDAVPLILDSGPARVGVESTIIDVSGDTPVCLRPGGIALADIERVIGQPVARAGADAAISAPGMLRSHYAPGLPVRLDAADVRPGEALLAFGSGQIAGAGNAVAMANLSPAGDLTEAAANLFAMLDELDRSGAAAIAVMPIPGDGLGEAINDRLARAAAPRETP